jgi:hypothetical protein
MNLIPVSSSDIKAIGYNTNTQTLQVEFLNRSLYEYYAVPSYVYDSFMTAISKGSYFNSHIKKAQYRYRKLR